MLSSPDGTRPVDRALFQLTRLIGTDLRRWPRVRLPTMLVARFSPRVTTRGDFSTGNNVEKEIGRPSYVISKVWSGLAYRAAPHVPRLFAPQLAADLSEQITRLTAEASSACRAGALNRDHVVEVLTSTSSWLQHYYSLRAPSSLLCGPFSFQNIGYSRSMSSRTPSTRTWSI